MSYDYGNDNEGNMISEIDIIEEPEECLRNINKQDLRDALYFLMGLREGIAIK